MRTVQRLEEIPFDRNSVVTVGTFDGVHRAHQEILRQAVARARGRSARSVVVTFDPHPKEVIGPHPENVHLLTTPSERREACEALGIDLMLVVPFDRDLAALSSREFTKRYLVDGIGASEVLEGYDHHWGRNREGDVSALRQFGKEFGFTVIAVDPIRQAGELVNSSTIREHLLRGSVAEAASLLGRPYEIRGRVVRGDERGRTLGYPTANLAPDHVRKLVPQDGIYVADVQSKGSAHAGMVSIGVRPTFHQDGRKTIEAHLLDFSGDLYDSELRIRFLERLRDELKFESADALVTQMRQDEEESRVLLRNHGYDH